MFNATYRDAVAGSPDATDGDIAAGVQQGLAAVLDLIDQGVHVVRVVTQPGPDNQWAWLARCTCGWVEVFDSSEAVDEAAPLHVTEPARAAVPKPLPQVDVPF